MAETMVMAFVIAGIAVSDGAACSSGKVQSSHVLKAMGVGDAATRAIRVSGNGQQNRMILESCRCVCASIQASQVTHGQPYLCW